jgi:hypothetical protein
MRADVDIDFSIRMLRGGKQGEKAGMQDRMACRKGKNARKEDGRCTCSNTQVSSHCLLCTDPTQAEAAQTLCSCIKRHVTAVNGVRH